MNERSIHLDLVNTREESNMKRNVYNEIFLVTRVIIIIIIICMFLNQQRYGLNTERSTRILGPNMHLDYTT